MRDRLGVFAAALWWGGMTLVAAVAVPLLFASLPAAMAGQTAARLFTALTWNAMACGFVLVLLARGRDHTASMDWGRGALPFIAAGMLLALLQEFAVAPRIVARENLRLWHGLGTGMMALQWLCAGVTLWKLSQSRPPMTPSPSGGG